MGLKISDRKSKVMVVKKDQRTFSERMLMNGGKKGMKWTNLISGSSSKCRYGNG